MRSAGSCLIPYRVALSAAQPKTCHTSSSRIFEDLPSGAMSVSPSGVLHAIQRLSVTMLDA